MKKILSNIIIRNIIIIFTIILFLLFNYNYDGIMIYSFILLSIIIIIFIKDLLIIYYLNKSIQHDKIILNKYNRNIIITEKSIYVLYFAFYRKILLDDIIYVDSYGYFYKNIKIVTRSKKYRINTRQLIYKPSLLWWLRSSNAEVKEIIDFIKIIKYKK